LRGSIKVRGRKEGGRYKKGGEMKEIGGRREEGGGRKEGGDLVVAGLMKRYFREMVIPVFSGPAEDQLSLFKRKHQG
jgi:hypothetical protein